eukprot:1148970-Pelagomonas_calceolata.AAC.5
MKEDMDRMAYINILQEQLPCQHTQIQKEDPQEAQQKFLPAQVSGNEETVNAPLTSLRDAKLLQCCFPNHTNLHIVRKAT